MLKPKRQTSSTITVTAPIGGWNAINPLATMSPNEAVIIDNWFCLPTELMTRKGYTEWNTGVDGNIESFINYDAPDGTIEMFVASDDAGACSIWDVSQQEPVIPSAVVTGLTSARFHSCAVANTGGTFTMAVNGADYLLLYDGATWQSVNSTSTPFAITGVDTSTLTDLIVHHRRVWLTEKDSMKCWYLDIDAIAGAAQSFDFAPLFQMGGSIAKIDTWTLDAGYGMDDYFVVITTAGEIAIYSGTDPSSADTWRLNGIYYCGSPVGRNCTMKYGGDVLLLNKDGLVPLSQWLMSSRVNIKTSITNKIQQRITDATSKYANNYGWQVVLFPPENMLFINIPISETEFEQYVMNTISGAWSRFTDITSTCWTFLNERCFFAYGGKVYRFWDGQSDNNTTINTDLLPAFSAFGSQSQIKRFTMARVSMGYDVSFAFSGQMSLDFDLATQPPAPYNMLSTSAGVWDVSDWDASIWGGTMTPFARWQMATGMAHYGSFRIKTSSKTSDVRYYATDYVMEGGGVL